MFLKKERFDSSSRTQSDLPFIGRAPELECPSTVRGGKEESLGVPRPEKCQLIKKNLIWFLLPLL